MNTLQEVVIDETRWPRIFGALRRAGLYSSCGCTGCASCQSAARRFLRGAARGARYAGSYQRSRWGARYPLFRRRLGGRQVSVILDTVDDPAIVDVALSPDAELRTETVKLRARDPVWEEAIRSRSHWPKGDGKDPVPRLLTVPRIIAPHPNAQWRKGASFADYSRVPSALGLYLIVWPNGAYLGKATELNRGIRKRIGEHVREHLQWSFAAVTDTAHLNQFKVYWLPMEGAASGTVAELERRYLNTISLRPQQEKAEGRASAARLAAYRAAGFRNRKELEYASGLLQP